jgi:hypothetical protein
MVLESSITITFTPARFDVSAIGPSTPGSRNHTAQQAYDFTSEERPVRGGAFRLIILPRKKCMLPLEQLTRSI